MTPAAALRVVHVDTERTWGGGQRQVFELALGLRSRGHRPWVVARPGTQLASALAEAGVPVIGLSPGWEWDLRAAAKLHRALARVRADIVHAHTAHALALAALATARTGVHLLASRRVALPLRRNALSRWKYARAERILAVSERVRGELRACGVADDRIAVVYSGVNLGRPVRRAGAQTLSALGAAPGRPLAVMVSSLIPPHKDPLTFLAALSAARGSGADLRALLIGDGPLAAQARRASRRLGLDGVVRLTGFRRDADELLAAADVAVLSSRDEGLGTTLLDAMAAGVPVVATAAGGVIEVVRDGVDGLLVPVGDGAALGAAIVRVLDDVTLAGALTAAARERVRQFAIERTIEDTLAVYRSVTGADGCAMRRAS